MQTPHHAQVRVAGHRRQHGCDFTSAKPTTLYGLGDNFDLQSSHPPVLMRGFRELLADIS